MNTFNIIAEILKSQNFQEIKGYNCFISLKPNIRVAVTHSQTKGVYEIRLESSYDDYTYPEKSIILEDRGGLIMIKSVSGDDDTELDKFTFELIGRIASHSSQIKLANITPRQLANYPSIKMVKLAVDLLKEKGFALKEESDLNKSIIETSPNQNGIWASIKVSDDLISISTSYEKNPDKLLVESHTLVLLKDKDGFFDKNKVYTYDKDNYKPAEMFEIIDFIKDQLFE